jgi:hypothetical protein
MRTTYLGPLLSASLLGSLTVACNGDDVDLGSTETESSKEADRSGPR